MNFKTIQNTFFFGFLAIATLLFFFLIKNFLFTIFWALVLAIVFYPLYKWFLRETKNRENISSVLSLLSVIFVIILPLVFVTSLFTKEAIELTKGISVNSIENTISEIAQKDLVDNALNNLGIDPAVAKNSAVEIAKKTFKKIGESSIEFGKSTLNIIINFFIMLYFLFFFFKDGKRMLIKISDILPLGNKIEKDIFIRFSTIVKSIFKGTLIVALVQGFISGVLFFAVGIKAALLWGVIMVLLSVIPAVGPSAILLPTAVFFLMTGAMWQGLVLLAGMIVVSTIDNILRPILVGRDTQMPDVIITISIFGGLAIYGITGLVIGPAIAGIFITMWQIFQEKFKADLDKN